MATRAEKIVEQLAILGRTNKSQSIIDTLVDEAVKFVQSKKGKITGGICEWCNKEARDPVILHRDCYYKSAEGEGLI